MRFELGDKVIYPNQGISVVESIESTNGAAGPSFYRLRLLAKSTLVMVPIDKVDEVGLRPIMTETDVEEVLDVLENGAVDEQINWKTRYKDNSDRMKNGSPVEVAGVLKGLFYLSERKTLSFREKRMLDRAHQLTVTEVAEVADETLEAVERKIIEALRRSRNGEGGLESGEAENEGSTGAATSVVPLRPPKRRRVAKGGGNRRRPVSISINRY
jgi:CarD family transcriptional regulator